MRNGRALQGHLDDILFRILDPFSDSVRNFRRFPHSEAHVTVFISYNHNGGKTGNPSALDGFGYTVDHDQLLFQIQCRYIDSLCHVLLLNFQNFRPASLAPAASSATRP